MWLPAAVTTASEGSFSDGLRSDPQYHDFLGKEPVARNHEILSEDVKQKYSYRFVTNLFKITRIC